jgi:hypothetical protein
MVYKNTTKNTFWLLGCFNSGINNGFCSDVLPVVGLFLLEKQEVLQA